MSLTQLHGIVRGPMTLTTLLTLDGTEKDERALTAAAAFAELAGGKVRIVRVFDSRHEPRSEVAESVRGATARFDSQTDRCAAWHVIEAIDVAAALLNEIAEHHVDFVVMATRAAGAVGRAIRGSVADRLVRESPCAILLVPPRAHLAKQIQLRRVLVPLDGSPDAETVVTRMLALRKADTLEFVLLEAVEQERTGGHILPPGVSTIADRAPDGERVEWINVQAEVAQRRLGAVADRLCAQGATADVRILESRDPGTTILEAMHNENVDFVAMTTRGEGGLQRMVLGSVAEHVVRYSDLPVLLVTAEAQRRAHTWGGMIIDE